jgi:FixJ family two-component response regulator
VLKSIISAAAKGDEVSNPLDKQIANEVSIGEVIIKIHHSRTMRRLKQNP